MTNYIIQKSTIDIWEIFDGNGETIPNLEGDSFCWSKEEAEDAIKLLEGAHKQIHDS